jgi:hypothetical protein
MPPNSVEQSSTTKRIALIDEGREAAAACSTSKYVVPGFPRPRDVVDPKDLTNGPRPFGTDHVRRVTPRLGAISNEGGAPSSLPAVLLV